MPWRSFSESTCAEAEDRVRRREGNESPSIAFRRSGHRPSAKRRRRRRIWVSCCLWWLLPARSQRAKTSFGNAKRRKELVVDGSAAHARSSLVRALRTSYRTADGMCRAVKQGAKRTCCISQSPGSGTGWPLTTGLERSSPRMETTPGGGPVRPGRVGVMWHKSTKSAAWSSSMLEASGVGPGLLSTSPQDSNDAPLPVSRCVPGGDPG